MSSFTREQLVDAPAARLPIRLRSVRPTVVESDADTFGRLAESPVSWRDQRGLWQLPDEVERVLAAL